MEDYQNSSRPTETMSRPTEAMGRPTELMSEESSIQTVHFSTGGFIDAYQITGIIADNTGEAAIFLTQKDDQKYVIKLYHQGKEPKAEVMDAVKNIRSPYIVPLLGSGWADGRYYEVLRYYHNGDLAKAAPISEDFIINTVVPNMNEGLNELHNRRIFHKDIKPNNIFFSDDKQNVVIGDFGISSIIQDGISVKVTGASRTLGYAAPETATGHFSRESDYYALGITLLHLVLGADPYQGMTDSQVLMHTMNYRLEIPASVSQRLTDLIHGLTVKERKDRWGYDIINKWIKGEYIEPPKAPVPQGIKPLDLGGRNLYDLESAGLALAENWEEGKKLLYRGLLTFFLTQFSQTVASKERDCAEERDQDMGLFKLIYILNPNAPLCWKGELFADLQALRDSVNKRLPYISDNYLQMLTKGALLYYLELKKADVRLIGRIREIQQEAQSKSNRAYFRWVRLLSDNNDFHFQGGTFSNVDQLAEYLYKKDDQIENLANRLLGNEDFFAWLEQLGYNEHVDRWEQTNN